MKKTVSVLLTVLLLMSSLVLPCLAEEETAVVDPGVSVAAEEDELAAAEFDDGSYDVDDEEAEEPPVDSFEAELFAVENDGSAEKFVAEFDVAETQDSILTIGADTTKKNLSRVVDNAGLFSDKEAEKLQKKIDAIREEFSFDVAIVTVTDLGGKSSMAYADDYYDYHNFGCGKDKDGCLLLIKEKTDTEDGKYWISTSGSGIKILNDSKIEKIGEKIVPSLKTGDYAAACNTFVDDVNKYVDDATGFRLKLLIIGAIIGLLIALAVIAILKAQLKSVRSKPNASDYYVDGSLALTGSYDVLVGHHVTRTKRQSESSSGSSTHTSSSGSSHGGGGGRF